VADIGSSTTAHLNRHEINYPEGYEALDNWAAWYRCADESGGSGICSPMFKDMKSGYREASNLRTQYDEEYALLVDRLMARLLRTGDFDIICVRFVSNLDSRSAAKRLSKNSVMTVDDYRLRLEAVIARVDMALTIALDNSNYRLTA
jgi:hypothetical protein